MDAITAEAYAVEGVESPRAPAAAVRSARARGRPPAGTGRDARRGGRNAGRRRHARLLRGRRRDGRGARQRLPPARHDPDRLRRLAGARLGARSRGAAPSGAGRPDRRRIGVRRGDDRLARGDRSAAPRANSARLQPGAGGLLALPYLAGERTPVNDPGATGAVVGLTYSTTPDELRRAFLDSVALSALDHADRLREHGIDPARWRVAGGATRNEALLRACCDALGRPLELMPGAGAALGPAALALRADGVRWQPAPERVVEPDAARSARFAVCSGSTARPTTGSRRRCTSSRSCADGASREPSEHPAGGRHAVLAHAPRGGRRACRGRARRRRRPRLRVRAGQPPPSPARAALAEIEPLRAAGPGLPLLASGDFVGAAREGDRVEDGVERVRRWLERAVALGSPILRVASGFYRAELAGRPDLIRLEQAFVTDVLDRTADEALASGVRLLLENHSDFTCAEYDAIVTTRRARAHGRLPRPHERRRRTRGSRRGRRAARPAGVRRSRQGFRPALDPAARQLPPARLRGPLPLPGRGRGAPGRADRRSCGRASAGASCS